jgi:hypothetical protein
LIHLASYNSVHSVPTQVGGVGGVGGTGGGQQLVQPHPGLQVSLGQDIFSYFLY